MDVVVSHSPLPPVRDVRGRRKYFRVPGPHPDSVLTTPSRMQPERVHPRVRVRSYIRIRIECIDMGQSGVSTGRPHASPGKKTPFPKGLCTLFCGISLCEIFFDSVSLSYARSISRDNIVYCRNGSIKHHPGKMP